MSYGPRLLGSYVLLEALLFVARQCPPFYDTLPRFYSGVSYLIFSKSIPFYQFLIYEAYHNDIMLSLYRWMNVTKGKERDTRMLNLLASLLFHINIRIFILYNYINYSLEVS